jgi:excisionase family DNA binding protein
MSKRNKQKTDLLTTKQVSSMLAVHEETVRRWITAGSLPALYLLQKVNGTRRVYRIEKKIIDQILAGQWPRRQG